MTFIKENQEADDISQKLSYADYVDDQDLLANTSAAMAWKELNGFK